MAGSPHFARIKADVLANVRLIPEGRLTTFEALGTHLDIVPRHAAYILATLDPMEAATTPWHRVVPQAGCLSRTNKQRANRQRALLEAEGLVISGDGAIDAFTDRFIVPTGPVSPRTL